MRKRYGILFGVVLVVACSAVGIVRALEASTSPWQKSANPTLIKTVDLPPNVMPPATNIDCTESTVRPYRGSQAVPSCLTTTTYGQAGTMGMIFNGTSEYIPVVPPWPFEGMQPIPNSATFLTYASAPVTGLYLGFYKAFLDKMNTTPRNVNGQWRYELNSFPDYVLANSSGQSVPANIYAMAFSANGVWMVVDLPGQGFVRLNLRTYQMQPFAPTMQQPGDYSTRLGHLAISNDGQTAVVKPNDYAQFKVYDLSKCGDTSLPVAPGVDRCAARDYYPSVSQELSGLKGIYQPRFINNSQISFSAVYNYATAPTSYKVARFTLTAPGESPVGMSYLGMGDSFASGEGAHEYVAGTDTSNNACHLSSRNYAFLLQAHLFPGGNSVACSGAVTDDIIDTSNEYDGQVKDNIIKTDRKNVAEIKANYTPGYIAQSEFIDQYRPEVITLSVGGNDIGFADVLKSCVSPAELPESCYPDYEDRLELANQINATFDRLVSTYKTVLKPGKRVYVVGYPQLTYPGGDCALNVNLDSHEVQLAADIIEYLNTVVERAAAKAGVRYVDVSQAFAKHRMCETISSDVAVNGFTAGNDNGIGRARVIGNESYHPNALGHRLFEQTIRTKTDELRQPMPDPDPTAKAPVVPTTLNNQSLPKSGRQTNTVVADTSMAPQLITRGQNVNILLENSIAVLKAYTAYKLVIHSSPVELATATTDAAGNLSATVQIPASVPPGFHTLHLYGPNMLGQPLDITRTVYVAASSSDYDGDGIDDAAQPEKCVLVASSGQDVDRDGVDDACDGYVAAAPAASTRVSNPVTLTNNTITLTR